MNSSDLILHLVNELIAEKEKNIILQYEKEPIKPVLDENNVKTKV